jgi:hypothetical protein
MDVSALKVGHKRLLGPSKKNTDTENGDGAASLCVFKELLIFFHSSLHIIYKVYNICST